VLNEDGSYTFTGIKESQTLKTGKNADIFTINCNGLAAIKVSAYGQLEKLVATSFSSLIVNGKTILSAEKPTDISVFVTNGIADITIADKDKSNKVTAVL
jgi:hypothetical protein